MQRNHFYELTMVKTRSGSAVGSRLTEEPEVLGSIPGLAHTFTDFDHETSF